MLTAAVEYGLEELREVGVYGRSLSHFSFLLWALFTPCLTHSGLERHVYRHMDSCVNRPLCMPVCKRICACCVCAVGAYGVFMADAIDARISQP